MNSLNFREPTQPPLAHSTSVSSLNCRELTFLFFVSPPCRKSYEFTYDSSHRFLRYWFFSIKTAAAFYAPNLSWPKSGQLRVRLFSCLSPPKKNLEYRVFRPFRSSRSCSILFFSFPEPLSLPLASNFLVLLWHSFLPRSFRSTKTHFLLRIYI